QTGPRVEQQHVEAECEDPPQHPPVEVGEAQPNPGVAPTDEEPRDAEIEPQTRDLDQGQDDQGRVEPQKTDREAQSQEDAAYPDQVPDHEVWCANMMPSGRSPMKPAETWTTIRPK